VAKKTVSVLAHEFDCLPGHVTTRATGEGGTLRVATMRAVSNLLDDPRLRGKRIGEFKLNVVVLK
jgi:hypothetical protein